jgi:hypothetical protein
VLATIGLRSAWSRDPGEYDMDLPWSKRVRILVLEALHRTATIELGCVVIYQLSSVKEEE